MKRSSLVAIFTLLLLVQSASGQRLVDRPVISAGLFRLASELDTTSVAGHGRSRTSDRLWLVMGKVGLGGAMGGLFALAGGHLAISLSGSQGWAQLGPAILGAMTGYTFGSALGVHVLSETDNAETSFASTLLSGFLGMGAGLAISTLSDGKGIGAAGPLLCPVLFEVIYTEFLE